MIDFVIGIFLGFIIGGLLGISTIEWDTNRKKKTNKNCGFFSFAEPRKAKCQRYRIAREYKIDNKYCMAVDVDGYTVLLLKGLDLFYDGQVVVEDEQMEFLEIGVYKENEYNDPHNYLVVTLASKK